MKPDVSMTADWYEDVPRGVHRPALIGAFILLFGVAGFGYWASMAPIDGAVVAAGSFVATGQNKVVQHLEGGVIKDILVKEGDVVQAGQVLIRLDPTDPVATLTRLQLRQDRLLAMQARLRAETSAQAEIRFPDALMSRSANPEVREILDGQAKEFGARRNNLAFEVRTIEQGIAAIRESIRGGEAQLGAIGRQLDLVKEELETKRALYEKGYLRKSEYLALERARASLEGQIGQLVGTTSDAKERIAREEQRIMHARASLVQAAAEQLRNVEAELDDVRERIRVAENARGRIEIRAPVKGTIIKMMYHTPGGVIAAGKDILELLPFNDDLVIEARIRPQDIDSVHAGQTALVRLTALNQRVTPMIPGQVVYVSADALPDDQASRMGGANTYVVRVTLDEKEVRQLPNFRSTPGMPAEIFIKTGERTFLDYLMQPVFDSFNRAFRER